MFLVLQAQKGDQCLRNKDGLVKKNSGVNIIKMLVKGCHMKLPSSSCTFQSAFKASFASQGLLLVQTF